MREFRNKSVSVAANSLLLIYIGLHSLPGSAAEQETQPWIADEAAASLENPVNANRRSISRGESVYERRCVVCHGETAHGNGPAANALVPKPADLTAAIVQNQTDGALYWKITEGKGAMPAWKMLLDDNERWSLVNYLRSLR